MLETHSEKEESEVVELTLKAVQDAHATVGHGAPLLEDLKVVSNEFILSCTLIMKLNGLKLENSWLVSKLCWDEETCKVP
jgi:hypothetical protein